MSFNLKVVLVLFYRYDRRTILVSSLEEKEALDQIVLVSVPIVYHTTLYICTLVQNNKIAQGDVNILSHLIFLNVDISAILFGNDA